jgi:hypothetical protein
MTIDVETPNIPASLRNALLADGAPPADLWTRIESTHRVRSARRRLRRLGGAVCMCALASVLAAGYLALRPAAQETTNWEARAEALELQLHALQRDTQIASGSAGEIESELGDIDRSLQTAYESGAPADQLTPLWKRRSELLDTLIVARKQNLLLTRI